MGQLEKQSKGGYTYHTDVALNSRGYVPLEKVKDQLQGHGVVRSQSWRYDPEGIERTITDGHGRKMFGN